MLIDTLESKPARLVTFPEGELLNLRIAEPNDANVGPTGILGYGFRPRSYQKLNLEIKSSGNFVENILDAGSTFTFKPNDLLDENGDSILDGTVQRLGSDNFWEPRVSQVCLLPNSIYAYNYINTAMKMVQLKKWQDVNADYGYIGMSVYCARTVANDHTIICLRRLVERRYNGVSCGYSWEEISATGLGGYISTVDPYADITELDDGSLILALSRKDGGSIEILFFKSFDCGKTWEKVNEVVATGSAVTTRIALNTIGKRIAVTFLYASGVNFYIFNSYSDDDGWTWTAKAVVINPIATNPSNWSFDSVKSFDGKLYVTYLLDAAGINKPCVVYTSDGANWSSGEIINSSSFESFSLVQHPSGAWMTYGIHSGELVWRKTDNSDPTDSWNTNASYSETMTMNLYDADGYIATDVCAKFFAYNGFVELGVIEFDNHSGTDYTIPLFLRCGMWNGVNINLLPTYDWFAQGFPSTADAHPNLNIFTRFGAVNFANFENSTDGFPALKIATTAADAFYYTSLIANSYDTGCVFRFSAKLKGTIGWFTIKSDQSSIGSNKRVAWSIHFANNTISLYDEYNSVTVLITSLINWVCSEWNDFIVVCKGTTVELYRAPISHYNEFLHYELVFSNNVTSIAYAAGTNYFNWGAIDYDGNLPTSQSLWRTMQIWRASDQDIVGWDFNDDLLGRKCILSREQGIMQGFGVRFIGAYAVEDDAWDLEVGAVYDPRNILTHSPTEQWRETEQSAASPERVFEWQIGNDFAGNEIRTLGNGIALFGKNFLNFKLRLLDKTGSGVNYVDTTTTHKGYICIRRVLKFTQGIAKYIIYENVAVLMTEAFSGSDNIKESSMIPGQYASNEYRNYYIEVLDGSAIGNVYRILDNNSESLVLEGDAETDGLNGNDQIAIFSDRVFFEFDPSTITNDYGSFYGWRLTIPTTSTSPSENQLRLGKILIGRWAELKDDEWQMNMNTVSGLQTQEGFGGRKATRRLKQERRVLGMSYTGLNDIGAGVNAVTALAKVMRFGETPVAYIDDDTLLSDDIGNCEPILMRLSGDVNQQRVVYEKEDFIFDTVPTTKSMQRNVFDADMTFEEVL
jgi:hypothetical protein